MPLNYIIYFTKFWSHSVHLVCHILIFIFSLFPSLSLRLSLAQSLALSISILIFFFIAVKVHILHIQPIHLLCQLAHSAQLFKIRSTYRGRGKKVCGGADGLRLCGCVWGREWGECGRDCKHWIEWVARTPYTDLWQSSYHHTHVSQILSHLLYTPSQPDKNKLYSN